MNAIITDNEKAIIDKHNRILSTISHDLKSPMIALLGFSRILLREIEATNENQRWLDMLKIIIDSGEDMFGLIEDILTMAKMEAGKEMVEFELIEDLAKELIGIEKTFGCEAKAKEIDLSVVIKSHLPVVRWDMKRLRYHVLNNLVSNALKFTPSGGHIVISAEAFEKTVLLKVTDTGPGIPAEMQDKIFKRFGHTEMCSERTKKGDGLGLYNAHLFVTQHSGRISLDKSVHHGATFLIELPVDILKQQEEGQSNIEDKKIKTINRHKLLL
ncbi:MAG: Non-motile and phage-resistance protein [Candidatus Scalindua arabica]|uniref:histidine kinase n=1 Tax=Candidatus Scalindua arabica TaxID=1127984 RepID=A0A942A4L0_9BACT|nr:Non-motile and phage-resistance protein [Candidatus Scalindua arabica]